MAAKPKVLAAVPFPALVMLERALGEHVQLVPAHDLHEALARLRAESDIALIVCGVHFDESRMFDLLRTARSDFAAMPFVCCRVLHSELPRVTIQAIDIAAKTLGAAAFVDRPALAREFGVDGADVQFRTRVLVHLRPGTARSGERPKG